MDIKTKGIFMISIIIGSKSDQNIAEKVTRILDEKEVNYDLQVISAHRNPDKTG